MVQAIEFRLVIRIAEASGNDNGTCLPASHGRHIAHINVPCGGSQTVSTRGGLVAQGVSVGTEQHTEEAVSISKGVPRVHWRRISHVDVVG
jgi:hypothetical protein